MKEFIMKAASFEQIQELLKMQDGTFVDDEKDYVVSNIIALWRNGVLQEKLISLGKPNLARQIDDVNMNQTVGTICHDIIKIILNGESPSSISYGTTSNSNSDYTWLDYYLNHDTY